MQHANPIQTMTMLPNIHSIVHDGLSRKSSLITHVMARAMHAKPTQRHIMRIASITCTQTQVLVE